MRMKKNRKPSPQQGLMRYNHAWHGEKLVKNGDRGSAKRLTPDKTLALYGKSFNWARHFLGQKWVQMPLVFINFCRVLDDMADGDIENGQYRLRSIRGGFYATLANVCDPLMVLPAVS